VVDLGGGQTISGETWKKISNGDAFRMNAWGFVVNARQILH